MKKFISMVLAASCISLPCYAAVEFKTDMENGICNLFGKVEEAAFNQNVSIIIKDKNEKEIHVSYAKTDNNGNFSYSFKFGELPTDEYEVSIGAYGLDEAIVLDEKIYYANSTDRTNALGAINATALKYKNNTISENEAISEILNTIDTSAKILDVYNTLYSKASSTLKTELAKKVLSGASYEKIANFKELFNREFAIMIMSEATNQNIDDVVKVMWETYNFTTCSTYQIYDKIENKNAVHTRLLSGEYTSLEDIRLRFEQSVILDKLEKATNITDAQAPYDNYSALFGFSYSNYPEWTTRDMAIASKGTYFVDMKALKDALDKKYEEPSYPSGGGNGGGGTSSSKGGLGMSAVPTQITTTKEEKKSSFSDMQNAQWAIDAVEHLYKQGIVSGNNVGGFEPSRSISREEFVKIVVNAFSLNDKNAVCEFSDVAKDSWSYEFVAAAVSKGIVKGTDDNFFNAKGNITRQDMAVIIKRVIDYANKSYDVKRDNTGFTDKEEIADYATDAVEYLYKTGILNGFEDGSFKPHNTATRAEAAYLLYKVIA